MLQLGEWHEICERKCKGREDDVTHNWVQHVVNPLTTIRNIIVQTPNGFSSEGMVDSTKPSLASFEVQCEKESNQDINLNVHIYGKYEHTDLCRGFRMYICN